MQTTSQYRSNHWHPFTENPLDRALNESVPGRQETSKILATALNILPTIPFPPPDSSDSRTSNPKPIARRIHLPRRLPKEASSQFTTSEKDQPKFCADQMIAYINTAKNDANQLWVQGKILEAEQTLLDCMSNLPHWYHNFDAEDLLLRIYLLQNKEEKALELIDYLLQLNAKKPFPYLKKIENSYTLAPKNFSLLVERLKNESNHTQDDLIGLASAKYYLITLNRTPAQNQAQIKYLNSQFNESLSLFLTQFPAGQAKREYVETLAKETGNSYFLNQDLLQFFHEENSKKAPLSAPKKTPKIKQILNPLLYEELAGAQTEQLKSAYESALEAPLSFEDRLQYLDFLIRHGDISTTLTQINDYLTTPLTKKPAHTLTLLKVELLISESDELEAMRLITEQVTNNPKHGPLWIEKARLHLNPLSRFYDLEKARESLLLGKQAFQYPNLYLGEWKLAFASKTDPSSAKRNLALLSNDLFGPSYLFSLQDPEASPSQKIHVFFTQMEDWLAETTPIYEARASGSQEDAFAEARRLYPHMSDESLYQFLSSPLGMNKRTLHQFIPTFNPSQKIAAVLGF